VREVVEKVHIYASNRLIPTGKDSSLPLSKLPVMRDTLIRIRDRWDELTSFLEILEQKFLSEKEISSELVHLIACAKIECIRFGLNSYFELKEKVGAFSVQEHSPFGTAQSFETSLYCQRFAEGDCAILEQKMARDSIKHYAKSPIAMVKGETCFISFSLIFIQFSSLDLFRIPLLYARKSTALEAQLLFAKLMLAGHMMMVSGDKTKAWLEGHEMVTKVARLQSILSIQQTIEKR